jgi:hypothetical protein
MATHGAELVRVLERTLGSLESRTTDVAGTGYVSPQQPVGEVAQKSVRFMARDPRDVPEAPLGSTLDQP